MLQKIYGIAPGVPQTVPGQQNTIGVYGPAGTRVPHAGGTELLGQRTPFPSPADRINQSAHFFSPRLRDGTGPDCPYQPAQDCERHRVGQSNRQIHTQPE